MDVENKINIVPTKWDLLLINDSINPGLNILGNLKIGENIGRITDISTYINKGSTCGLIDGGNISYDDYDIICSSGIGYVEDNSEGYFKKLIWPQQMLSASAYNIGKDIYI